MADGTVVISAIACAIGLKLFKPNYSGTHSINGVHRRAKHWPQRAPRPSTMMVELFGRKEL
jgi:hypothetical protein